MKNDEYRSAPKTAWEKPPRSIVAGSDANEEWISDPALTKYRALVGVGEDKRRLELSLLIALVAFILLTFVVFPEVASRMIGGDEEMDRIEIPVFIQPPVERERREMEPQRRQETRRNEFSSIPDISRPHADETLVPDVPIEEFKVDTAHVDGLDFGSADAPPILEIAGDIQRPVVRFTGPKPFPQKAKILRRSGQVRVRMIVYRTGEWKVVGITEETPPDMGFGDACLAYLKTSVWQPATQNGRPIDVYYDLTIRFNLESSSG